MANRDSSANDELQIYRGKDYVVNDYITIRHPILDEIADYGEREYLSLITSLTTTQRDIMNQ